MKNLNYRRLQGDGFFLSPMRTDEEAILLYLKWINEEDILPWIHRNQVIINYDNQEELAKKIKDPTEFNFNIILEENYKEILVGNCNIKIHNLFTSDANISILIGENTSRNNGLGTKVMKRLVKFGFEELNLHRMNLSLNAENERAHKCYLNAGFKDCGLAHETHFHKGHYTDTIFMEVLSKDYFTNKEA